MDYKIIGGKTTAKGSPNLSAGFSVKAKRKDGGDIDLRFPTDISREDLAKSVERFFRLLHQHHTQDGNDPLTAAMDETGYLTGPGWQAVVYMNPATGGLEFIDYVRTSQQGQFVSRPLPAELL